MRSVCWTYFLAVFCVVVFASTGDANYYYAEYDYGEPDYSEFDSDGRWFSQEECMRPCKQGERPRICYYHINVEYSATMGPTCDVCRPKQDHTLHPNECDCIVGNGVEKSVLSYNNSIPGPSIQICKHDFVIIDVENEAEGLETTIHWHGVFQKGFQYYDGVPFLTQCPIHSNNIFRYQFQVNNPGTHFYHSHISLQMMDGLYGSFVVRNPDDVHLNAYDEDRPEHVILYSDWMHELAFTRYPGVYRNRSGQLPQSILINGRGDWIDPQSGGQTNASLAQFKVTAGTRYRFRTINSFSTVCIAEFSIEGHQLTIIAQDGESVKPKAVDKIISASGERVDFVLNANKSPSCYWIRIRALGECADVKVQQFAVLKYSDANCESPSRARPLYESTTSGIEYNSINITNCDRRNVSNVVCVNQLQSAEPNNVQNARAYYRLELGFGFYTYNITNQLTRHEVAIDKSSVTSLVNNISFVDGPAPLISQREGYEKVCKPLQYSTCTEPCFCTQVVHIPLNVILDIQLCDDDPQPLLEHPFHMHGYSFEVREVTVYSKRPTLEDKKQLWQKYEQNARNGLYNNAPKKDTLKISRSSCAIIRIFTDNPGWWLYHCHFLWHTMTGMNIVLHVGDDMDLPPVPPNFPRCYNWQPSFHY